MTSRQKNLFILINLNTCIWEINQNPGKHRKKLDRESMMPHGGDFKYSNKVTENIVSHSPIFYNKLMLFTVTRELKMSAKLGPV